MHAATLISRMMYYIYIDIYNVYLWPKTCSYSLCHNIIYVMCTLINVGIGIVLYIGTCNGMCEAIRLDDVTACGLWKKTYLKSTNVYTWFNAHCSFLFIINRTIHYIIIIYINIPLGYTTQQSKITTIIIIIISVMHNNIIIIDNIQQR